MKKLIIPALCVLALAACVNRKQADTRLERGCKAAAKVFSEDGISIKSIKQSAFGESKEFGKGYRVVDLTIIETDGWADLEKDVECTFVEDIGAFNLSHSASLYQLKISDEVYGVQNGELLGDFDTHMKLMLAVESAMTAQTLK